MAFVYHSFLDMPHGVSMSTHTTSTLAMPWPLPPSPTTASSRACLAMQTLSPSPTAVCMYPDYLLPHTHAHTHAHTHTPRNWSVSQRPGDLCVDSTSNMQFQNWQIVKEIKINVCLWLYYYYYYKQCNIRMVPWLGRIPTAVLQHKTKTFFRIIFR